MSREDLKALRAGFPSKKDVLAETPDPGVRAMLRRAQALGVETAFDRFDAQKPHCGFGLEGTCCRICHMGPCRVTPKSPRGVCGAGADLIVARNLLRWVAAGVASHGARGREVMLALKAASEGRLPGPIHGADKVRATARAFGLEVEGKGIEALAGEIADILLEDLSRTLPAPHRTLHALAPAERIDTWRALDILPVGAYHEVFEALHRTGVGTDGDWRNVLQQALRCGLAFAWSAVMGSAIAMDCLYGPPRRARISANFGAITPDTVNIAIHGHSPLLASAIVEVADREALREAARARGAAGIRFYGVCCSGLSALYRHGGVHPLANAVGAELVMATGALDLWVADVQDVYPGIMDVARCFHTRVVTTSDSARLPGAVHLGFEHDHRNLDRIEAIAEDIVHLAIDNFPRRRAENVHIPSVSVDAEIGFSVESVLETFGGAELMATHLKNGSIRGVVNLVGCNNPKVMYERAIVEVADFLLAHDVLLLTNGCASFPLLKLGYCNETALAKAGPGLRALLTERGLPGVLHMGECLDNARASGLFRAVAAAAGEPLKRLPLAFSSPEWSNEKGVGAAMSFRLLGLDSYHCIGAPIGGSERVARFLGEETGSLLGARMVVEREPRALARRIVADFEARRRALGWATATPVDVNEGSRDQ